MESQIPQSVSAFLTDARVQSGVEAALGYGPGKLPPGLEWSELTDFYAASLAAQTVRTEYAVTLAKLWSSIWPEAPAGWVAMSIEEQSEDYNLSVGEVWKWGFWRGFTGAAAKSVDRTRGAAAHYLWLGLSLESRGACLGVNTDLPCDSGFEAEGFEYDEEGLAWWSAPVPLGDDCVSVSSLQTVAASIASRLEAVGAM